MSIEDPAVIVCSISGSLANRDQCPAIPYTPEEYAAEARRIVDEGGVMIHIHARTPDGAPSYEVEDFRAISDAIRGECGDDVIINFSTGAMGVSMEKRIEYLRECRPEEHLVVHAQAEQDGEHHHRDEARHRGGGVDADELPEPAAVGGDSDHAVGG